MASINSGCETYDKVTEINFIVKGSLVNCVTSTCCTSQWSGPDKCFILRGVILLRRG